MRGKKQKRGRNPERKPGRKHDRHPPEKKRAPLARLPARPPVKSKSQQIEGRISLHRDGYGFVSRPSGGPDIFIPPPYIGGAMQGDTVTVRITSARGDRIEGAVVNVVRRVQTSIVGTFHEHPRGNYVQAIDERVRERIFIAPGDEIPSAPLSRDRVGPRVEVDYNSPDGLIVDVELTSFPGAGVTPRGKVIEVLGRRDDFGVDVEIIIRKHHLRHHFPPEVVAQATAVPATIPAGEVARRRDFRSLPIVTIDGESARDFDDAVLVNRLPNGNFELQVHIADVSYYVRPGSPIDREAELRGTSVYFPDRAIPMLPIELSSGLCSLRPNEDRLVMSCLMEIDPQGEIVGHELMPGVIRSSARLTYTQVNAEIEKYPLMVALQAALYDKRQRRGSIDFDLPEPEISFDEHGLMRSIVKSERNIAHRLIEEFMLAAAETVARHLEAAGVPSVYRIHEQPDLKKVAEFEQVAATFGYSLGTGPLPIQRMRVRGKVVEVPNPAKFKISPRNYQRLAAKIAGTPSERMLSFLMLRSLKQARYSAHNVGHFALATRSYTHFTSPIRRYPDLMVHRILKAVLEKRPPNPELASEEAIEPVARQSSESERAADDAERELMDWKKVRFMEIRLGEEFEALVIHVNRQGFFIELDDLFIEGFVPAATLADDDYRYLDATKEWVAQRSKRRYKLGGRLRVLVERIDPVRQQIHFSPLP
ncbi:MAG TPA: ribonuclease R [Terriglobales bacterium]|nr:ribonuclease R [Terriglobales bacterium]